MKKIFNYILSAILFFGVVSCQEDELLADWIADNPNDPTVVTGDPGDLDLSKLVVLGTSLASGVQDGALYTAGQSKSFPALLGEQFRINGLGGGAFNQPDINSAYGYHLIFNPTGVPNVYVGRSLLDLSDKKPVAEANGELPAPFAGNKTTLNNISAPLLYTGQLVITETGGSGGMGHPYYSPLYARFASAPGTSTMIGDAIAKQGTFFAYEGGMNDVLLYALRGGDGSAPISTEPAFTGATQAAIGGLASGGTGSYPVEGVVTNIPPVLVFPFFQAVKNNIIPMDQAIADATNNAYATYNGGLDLAAACGLITDSERLARKISFSASTTNSVVIVDKTLTSVVIPANCAGAGVPAGDTPLPNYRQAKSSDIILLTAGAVIGTLADPNNSSSVIGVGVPLADKYVLLPSEQQAIEVARGTFNASLQTTVTNLNAAGADIAFVDIQSIFLDAAGISDGVPGISVQGYNLSPDFAPNGIFSSDGIHPNQRGHGIIANKIIGSLNSRWGTSIPDVNVIRLLGVPFRP